MSISDRYEKLKSEINTVAIGCGRKPEDINLIAVSKTVGIEQIQEAINCGAFHFGENRVQELVEKFEALPKNLHWHQIGRLQTNKVKYLIGKNILIHSVDREELVLEIARLSQKTGANTEILVQVNVSGEETKTGISPESLDDFLDFIAKQNGIIVVGLMTIAPNTDDLDEIRRVFAFLRKKYIDIQNKRIDNNIQMKYLSMGMSHDYKIAIEEGSNMLRIGTLIFGER